MSRAENIRFVLGYVIDNDVPVQVVPACKELDALESERDRYHRLLIRARKELRSVLADINAEQIPHDGDDFHELLRDLDAALSK